MLDDAELLLESVLMLAPDYHAARYDYALVLLQRHKYARGAARSSRSCLQLEPDNRDYRTLYATACVGLGDHERGDRSSIASCSPRRPQAAELHLSIAHALKTLGRQQEAIEAYRARRRVQAEFRRRLLEPRQSQDLSLHRRGDRAHARRGGVAGNAARSIAIICVLRSARRSRTAASTPNRWRYYERGNALKKAESRYRLELIERNARLQIDGLHARVLRGAARLRLPRPDPIFIVGLPRSGSTLLEQILASHSQVEGTQELADIPRLVQRAAGPRAPTRQTRAIRRVLARSRRRRISGARREIPRRHARSTAPASRSSSTRCRTISATSASSI